LKIIPIEELRERMAIQFGRQRVQLSLFLPPPTKRLNKDPEEILHIETK